MKKWFMIYLLAIIVFAATTPAKAEGIAKKELPAKFELMVTGTEVEIVTLGGIDYECTTKYYFVNGKEHINGVFDRCFPLTSAEPTPDPEPEPTEDEPTICNGCPDINISQPMRTIKNKKFKSYNLNFGIPCCECYQKMMQK